MVGMRNRDAGTAGPGAQRIDQFKCRKFDFFVQLNRSNPVVIQTVQFTGFAICPVGYVSDAIENSVLKVGETSHRLYNTHFIWSAIDEIVKINMYIT